MEKKKILLVDDEEMILESMQDYLIIVGFDVMTALNGEEALLKIEESSMPDLVITDWMMPKMGGKGLISALIRMPNTPPIIVVSGKPEPELALKMGAREVISKPISIINLEKKIKYFLQV